MSSYWDAEEMACEILSIDYDTWCNAENQADLDDLLYHKYEISMDILERLLGDLAKFTVVTKSPISGEKYQGFVKPEESRYIYKIEYMEEKVNE